MDMPADVDARSTEETRELKTKPMAEVVDTETELRYRHTRIEQPPHELLVIKRQLHQAATAR